MDIVKQSSGWNETEVIKQRTMTYYLKRGSKYYFRNKTGFLRLEAVGLDEQMKGVKYGTEVDIKMEGGPATTNKASQKFKKALKRAENYYDSQVGVRIAESPEKPTTTQ